MVTTAWYVYWYDEKEGEAWHYNYMDNFDKRNIASYNYNYACRVSSIKGAGSAGEAPPPNCSTFLPKTLQSKMLNFSP